MPIQYSSIKSLISTIISIVTSDPRLFVRHVMVLFREKMNVPPELDSDGLYHAKIRDVSFIIDGKAYPKVARDVANGAYEITLIHQLPKLVKTAYALT